MPPAMLGNWETTKRDDDGNGSYSSAETETRTHNKANEILSRVPNSVTLPFVYDDAGNLKEENFSASASHLFEHDSWNRLVKHSIDGVSTVVNAEYEYNGLHWRTIKRLPPNSPYGISNEGGSATVGILRKMYYSAAWQLLEEQIDTDYTGSPGTNRTCQQIWGARYIDDPVMRVTDSTPGGSFYHITDHQFSTVAIVESGSAALVERVRYDAYGKATHRWPHDFNDDGYATLGPPGDYASLYTLSLGPTAMSSASYDPNMDLNRDGIINAADDSIWSTLGIRGPAADGEICGRGYNGVDNVVGYCGYIFAPEITGGTASQKYCVRFRWYDPVGGRWMERDPAEYISGTNLYVYGRSNPVASIDPMGLDDFDIIINGEIWTTPIEGDKRHIHKYNGVDQGVHMHGPNGDKYFPMTGRIKDRHGRWCNAPAKFIEEMNKKLYEQGLNKIGAKLQNYRKAEKKLGIRKAGGAAAALLFAFNLVNQARAAEGNAAEMRVELLRYLNAVEDGKMDLANIAAQGIVEKVRELFGNDIAALKLWEKLNNGGESDEREESKCEEVCDKPSDDKNMSGK